MTNIHEFAHKLQANADDEDLIDDAFDICSQIVQQCPSNVKLSTDTKLSLYGLFKQCTIGDIDKPAPSQLAYAEYAKYCAWSQHQGKTKQAAKKEYFDVVYQDVVQRHNLSAHMFKSSSEAAASTSSSSSAPFSVNSKMSEEEFDEKVHGDRNELFNKFDLTDTNSDIDLDAIRTYIEGNQIDINKHNENNTTFLHLAVDNEHYELTRLLVQHFKADTNVCDDMGYTPLHCSAMNDDERIIQLLLEHGADKTITSLDGESAADLAESEQTKQLLS
eukprot:CAMPEP_0202686562 /NCGR_PEP_ID=MMETSP1385-20130828/2311_1 /ASSEMBLY_ACC=CAM_ASM_000861 /TAXON_ID=933848 /ORGANISM="Elphidium margaritaceum" /LENGTH=274 /DNA_ID=CAMNT_0049341159 /DNA_START=213 /DNA_END=1033 /DNA_ORIENTATION=-